VDWGSVGALVRLLWRAAAPGLKPLRLPRAQQRQCGAGRKHKGNQHGKYLCDLSALVVAAQESNVSWISRLEEHQKSKCFHAIVPPIYEIALHTPKQQMLPENSSVNLGGMAQFGTSWTGPDTDRRRIKFGSVAEELVLKLVARRLRHRRASKRFDLVCVVWCSVEIMGANGKIQQHAKLSSGRQRSQRLTMNT